MSKATRRTWRKQQERTAFARRLVEREARMKGFKPATVGETLALLQRRGK